MKRQPEGIPTGGQFAPDRKGEPASSLASGVQERFDRTMSMDDLEIAERNQVLGGVHLDMGESENYQELADGEVVNNIDVTRSEDGYIVEASKNENLHHLAPSDLNYDEKNDWLDHNRDNLDKFFKERYGASVDYSIEGGWDESVIKAERTIPNGEDATEAAIADAAHVSMTDFHNESDPGTFGTENMDRLLQDQCTEPPVIPEPAWDARLVFSDAHGTDYVLAGQIQKEPTIPGWKRRYNRYTGEYTTTTPDGDEWTYKVAK